MNPNASSCDRPRLACRVARVWSSLADRKLADRKLAGHIASCSSCREYFSACAVLETELRSEAVRRAATAPASTELARQVLSGLAAPTRNAAPSRRRPALPLGLGAAIAAAAIVAISLIPETAPPAGANPAIALTPSEVQAIVNSAATLTDRWLNIVGPRAGTAIQNNALQQEMASVYADARSAIDFLAMNFLPAASPLAPTEPERPRSG